jgi:hypothetical protein
VAGIPIPANSDGFEIEYTPATAAPDFMNFLLSIVVQFLIFDENS